MTIITQAELDKAMGAKVDAAELASRKVGGSQGAMEAQFVAQTDDVRLHHGAGNRGGAVYDGRELPPSNHYGSGTIISVNDAPPLHDVLEPEGKVAPGPSGPKQQMTPAQFLERFKAKNKK